MVNYYRLGLLGCGEVLLLMLCALAIVGSQSTAIAQTVVQTDKAATDPNKNKIPQGLKYPGEEIRNGLLSAANKFERAARANPHDVANHLGVADINTMLWCFGFVPRDDVMPKVKTAAQTAIKLDGKLAAAHTALGIVMLAEWDWAGAEKQLQAAVRLEPDRALSHHWYALYLTAMGRHEEALRESEQAVKLDPSPGMQTGLGAILYFSRDWTRMIDQMSATIKQNPEFSPGHDWLGMAYVQEKRFDESIATYKKAVKLSGGLAEILAGLGHAYGMAGQHEEARQVLRQLQEMDKHWYVPPVQIAYVHVGLGEIDETIQLLERAYLERSWELVFLQVEPWFDDIRAEPRFVKLLKEIKFSKQKE